MVSALIYSSLCKGIKSSWRVSKRLSPSLYCFFLVSSRHWVYRNSSKSNGWRVPRAEPITANLLYSPEQKLYHWYMVSAINMLRTKKFWKKRFNTAWIFLPSVHCDKVMSLRQGWLHITRAVINIKWTVWDCSCSILVIVGI